MVEIRYFASVAEAAGTPREKVALPEGMTAGELRSHLAQSRPGEFSRLVGISALLVNGVSADDVSVLPSAATVDVLPPFAGG
ncbi:MoaD/ThiS family protein [Flaviflexus equikiangi]|uniref:MoaD/ThiS family protein n=1 Tax=Flaviflexus equikiangi TaxID=2758573 RepID=A0ABS2TH18_9ACTO|nr:MoaD/ThiS family protein [Flaviflexus equikiangi]MBM9433958.1 MoaD/ThiS family protein [Flaviflexus equikiangi]